MDRWPCSKIGASAYHWFSGDDRSFIVRVVTRFVTELAVGLVKWPRLRKLAADDACDVLDGFWIVILETDTSPNTRHRHVDEGVHAFLQQADCRAGPFNGEAEENASGMNLNPRRWPLRAEGGPNLFGHGTDHTYDKVDRVTSQAIKRPTFKRRPLDIWRRTQASSLSSSALSIAKAKNAKTSARIFSSGSARSSSL
jgi:hypothetical protein